MISPVPKKILYVISMGVMLSLYALNRFYGTDAAELFLMLTAMIGIFWATEPEKTASNLKRQEKPHSNPTSFLSTQDKDSKRD